MKTPWSDMPAWSVLVQRWAEEMATLGQPVERMTTTIDVVCADAYELKRVSMVEGLWISRHTLRQKSPLAAADLLAENENSVNRLPDTREIARSLAQTSGDPESIAAVLIAATALGYADYGDSLQMAGRLARARLEAAGVSLPRQSRRPTFLTEDRFDLSGMDADALPHALAVEHAGLFTGQVAVRIRPLRQTEDGTRFPAWEEKRVGLTNTMTIAHAIPVTPAVAQAAKRSEAVSHHRVALSSLPLDEQHTIIDAVADGLASQGVMIDVITDFGSERRSSSLFGPLLHVAVDPSQNDGWRLHFSRPTLMTIVPDNRDATVVTVTEDGAIAEAELAALAALVTRTVKMANRIDGEGMKIDAWERVDPRDLRITPLTRRLLDRSSPNLLENIEWRIGDEGKDYPEPQSFAAVNAMGLRATNGRVHLVRTWLPCPRDGGLLIEDDGITHKVTTPRHIPRTKLDQPIGSVLGQPDLADIEDVTVDSITRDFEGRSVIYLRSRPTSLPFPHEFRERL